MTAVSELSRRVLISPRVQMIEREMVPLVSMKNWAAYFDFFRSGKSIIFGLFFKNMLHIFLAKSGNLPRCCFQSGSRCHHWKITCTITPPDMDDNYVV